IRRNHSATHLLHHALRATLGTHVRQKGSLVAPERLRFDFAHFQPLSGEELAEIEQRANELVLANLPADTQVMSYDEAITTGAMAFFEEKYADRVRVVRIGPTAELCGGTHVHRSGDIGLLRIASEGGIAAGVRRIEAVTGLGALRHVQELGQLLGSVAERLHVQPDAAPARIERLQRQLREQEKEIATLKGRLAGASLEELLSSARCIGPARVVASQVSDLDAEGMLALGDRLREALRSGALLLTTVAADKVQLLCMVTADLIPRLHAGNMVRELARIVGGGGGGAPHMAKAGGKDPAAIPRMIERFHQLVQETLLGG
ncbi:MAG: alanine--tRNA ligase, partial [Deltaproteobacteria bacterium]|nr:alanine--tRNA ligase [Deltaproteobacteria bacterium]